jgi:hypothetical protein
MVASSPLGTMAILCEPDLTWSATSGSHLIEWGCLPARSQMLSCAPGGTRTPNRLIRSQMLYPLRYGRSYETGS